MDVRHLPLEHPHTYREIRHLVIEAVLPGLEQVAGAALSHLQPPLPARGTAGPVVIDTDADPPGSDDRKTLLAARTRTLAALLVCHQAQLAASALQTLQPRQQTLDGEPPRPQSKHRKQLAANDDAAETRWDLVLWLLDGLLVRDFSGKKVSPAERCGAPFYLYRLAQHLVTSTEWKTPHAVVSLKEVLSELSAEHTRERLQAYYGGADSINHITKALRPVDRHQNAALHLLTNRVSLPDPASRVVGEPYQDQEFCIRQALRRWHIPVRWLMNWTDHLPQIRRALSGHPAMKDAVTDDELGSALSSCKDVYLKTPEATEQKLAEVLQQLADLHELGGAGVGIISVDDQDDLLGRLGSAAEAVEPAGEAEGSDGPAAVESPLPGHDPAGMDTAGPLGSVFKALDHVHQPFVRVGALLRLLKRIPVKADRLALGKALVAWWQQPMFDGQSLFERVGVKPGIAGLTDAALAHAIGTLPATFKTLVDDAVASFDAAVASFGEADVDPRRGDDSQA